MTQERAAPPSLRLFVAVELPDETKRQLAATIGALKRDGVDLGMRWVRPEGIHVTLKFLGAVESARVGAIDAGLRVALAGQRPFVLRPHGLGSFGGRRNLRVVWVGLAGDTGALAALATRVEEALAPLGFPTEQRAFNPHLTLARVRDETPPAERERMSEALRDVRAPAFTEFRVARVSLMQSTLGRGGAVYDALQTFALTER